MERKLVLESCLKHKTWGLLEMSVLLTSDIVEIDMTSKDLNLDTWREQMADIDIKLKYEKHQDLFFSLLRARCPVSNRRKKACQYSRLEAAL